jgi:hypothetical protein
VAAGAGAAVAGAVPVDRGAGVAAVGWAKVVSVAANSVPVISVPALASTVVGGAVDVVVDSGTSPVVVGAVVVAPVVAGATVVLVAAAAATASCCACCLVAVAAASAWAIRAAPPSVAEMLAPATVIFEAKAVDGRRRRISATRLHRQHEQRQGGSEQHGHRRRPAEGAPRQCPRGRVHHGVGSAHASVSAGR